MSTQQLQILSKGGPTVSVAINGFEMVAVQCGGGEAAGVSASPISGPIPVCP